MNERPRVLVVDDENVIREILETVLTEEGFEVQVAEDGRAALMLLDAFRPDAIVLDLMMPVMDGWAFRAAQSNRADCAGVPVIVLSAARNARAAAEQMGAAATITKPFDLNDVVHTVRKLTPRTN